MANDIRFKSVAEAWLESIKETVGQNTLSHYRGYIKNYMIPYLDTEDTHQTIEAVNRNIDCYVANIEANIKENVAKKVYPVFSMILDYALAQGYISFNYSKVIVPFAKDEGLSYSEIGIEQLSSILSQARHDGMLPDFVLMLDLGLSRGELLGLKWSDVDLDHKMITLRRLVVARNGITQTVPTESPKQLSVMDITAEILAKCKDNVTNKDAYLFASPSDVIMPFNPSAYRKKIAKVTSKALDGNSITIELIGFILSIIQDRTMGATGNVTDRASILDLAMENSTTITATKAKYRKPGEGYISQLGPNCWQGRYTPTVDGKRVSKNVYAPTKEECEKKLADIIRTTKSKFN